MWIERRMNKHVYVCYKPLLKVQSSFQCKHTSIHNTLELIRVDRFLHVESEQNETFTQKCHLHITWNCDLFALNLFALNYIDITDWTSGCQGHFFLKKNPLFLKWKRTTLVYIITNWIFDRKSNHLSQILDELVKCF